MLPARRDTSTPARIRRQARRWQSAAWDLLPARRKASAPARLRRRARELLPAQQLDLPWARSGAAVATREAVLRFVLKPLLAFYTRRRTTGREKLARVRGPVILVANHVSHIDTPLILAALPRRFRRRTVVGAASDYFYRNQVVAMMVSLIFNTVPMDRRGGGLTKQAAGHVDQLLDRGWNLLLYPEGTRSRNGAPGRLRRGAAVIAARHHMPIIPIRITGTRAAMPHGRMWPCRMRTRNGSKRHPVSIAFGDPIAPAEDALAVIKTVQRFFDNGDQPALTNGQRQLPAASSSPR